MTGDNLPGDYHVIRYAKPTSVRTNGKVDGCAFCLRENRPDDTGLSVNWLECFSNRTKEKQLAEVRRLARLKMREGGSLAELNIGATKQYVRTVFDGLRFIHRPLAAEDEFEADLSHSEITGLPQGNSPEAELIGDMIAQSINAVYPAVLRQQEGT